MKETERIHINFRRFVKNDDVNSYDEEFHSKKRHTYKFMIPFIFRYVDVEWELKNTSDREEEKFLALFLNDYCRQDENQIKSLSQTREMKRLVDRNFLFD